MHDARPTFIVLKFADPHLLKCGQRSENRTADPNGVLPLRRSDDLDLHSLRRQGDHLFLHTIRYTGEHAGPAGHHRVAVEIAADIDIALHNTVEIGLVNSRRFHPEKTWLEQRLWTAETLVADGDDLAVG